MGNHTLCHGTVGLYVIERGTNEVTSNITGRLDLGLGTLFKTRKLGFSFIRHSDSMLTHVHTLALSKNSTEHEQRTNSK